MTQDFNERRIGGNNLLRAVIDTTVDAMVIIDRGGAIRVFNLAAQKLFGYAPREVVGRNVSVLMPPGDRERHDGYMHHYQETGEARIIGIGREVVGQRRDGSTFPLELAVGEIKGRDDFAYVGVLRDLTQHKRSTEALVEARARAERANMAKTEFLSRMSHELRTPMNAILGFAQLLRLSGAGALTQEQTEDYLDSIIAPAEHLTQLIDDILDLTRIEIGRLRVARETVNLADAVASALTMAQPMAQRFGVSIFNRCVERSGSPCVTADPIRLRQCIVNLLTNAIKYNRSPGRVLVDFAPLDGEGGEFVRLTVEDSGVGIPEDRFGELFKPFSRLHEALEHVEGAGIGLAVTRQLIEAMGGSVTAESEVGRGSRFHLDLPKAAADATAPARPKVSVDWSDARSDQESRKIVLYIEDNPTNVYLMESLLKRIPGADLRIAYTAELGLEIAEAIRVRVIILDINLPGMDGFEALMRLRSREQTADVPVIGLSARATKVDLERAADLGFYRYLTKPVNVPELMDTLRAVL
ncbi:MAG TPA: PAS domain S-box protein [Candidatus Cybelea sp.]|nr:PAS domain S-box protein [Candidatus Cybelea sp.]